jgi:hypothetical protein
MAHRLALEIEALRAEGISAHQGLARALMERGVPTPRGSGIWTHTTVARLLARVGADIIHQTAESVSRPTVAATSASSRSSCPR